jgi:hypothetical protein
MDLVFSLMRLHFMFGDFSGLKRDIKKARAPPHAASHGATCPARRLTRGVSCHTPRRLWRAAEGAA